MGSFICDARRPALAVALVVILAVRPAAVRAEAGDRPTAKRDAETKLQQGVILLKEGRYAEALARFKEGYALVPSPLILYDFGLAQLGMGDDPEALQSFEDFLRLAPDAPEDKRHKASQYSDELRKRVAVVTVNADVSAGAVRLDGRDIGPVEFPRRFYLLPGLHEFAVRAADVSHTTAVTCVAGERQTVSFALAEPRSESPAGGAAAPAQSAATRLQLSPSTKPAVLLPLSPPADAPREPASNEHGHPARWWALTAAAAGAASLGAGLTFGVLASNEAANVTADSQNRREFVPADEAAGLRDQRLQIVFLSVGTAAVLAGLGIYALIRSREATGASQGPR